MRKKIVSPWVEQKRSRKEEAIRKREAVLATAARLFQEKGFENCTLSEVAEALDVTKPTIYYYGKSKEMLLVEILNDATEAMVSAFLRASELDSPGIEKLRVAMHDYAEIRLSDYGRCLALVRDAIMSPENREALAERGRRAKAHVYKIFDDGFADGTIRKADRLFLYQTLFGALNWLHMWIHEAQGMRLGEVVDRQIDIFMRGIAGPAIRD
ncbi:MAG: TetR/AcrR family transcriptional regulator [Sphingopyxis sp.]|nr:TetR/AcrR family transcriptional regulator [Sphingopyxis sp.]